MKSRAMDYDDLNARAGRHEWGYVEPTEAAWEILEETVEPFREDMKRHLDLGLEADTHDRAYREQEEMTSRTGSQGVGVPCFQPSPRHARCGFAPRLSMVEQQKAEN